MLGLSEAYETDVHADFLLVAHTYLFRHKRIVTASEELGNWPNGENDLPDGANFWLNELRGESATALPI
jgi:hypothetical protein